MVPVCPSCRSNMNVLMGLLLGWSGVVPVSLATQATRVSVTGRAMSRMIRQKNVWPTTCKNHYGCSTMRHAPPRDRAYVNSTHYTLSPGRTLIPLLEYQRTHSPES